MLLLSGCGSVGESVSNFIENDANIGKNAPAVNGTIGDIEALNEEAAKTETEYESEEEKAAKAAKKHQEELSKKADEIISQMTAEEKNAVSHRGNALRAFAAELKNYLEKH